MRDEMLIEDDDIADVSTRIIMPKHGGAYIKEIRTFEHKWLYEDRSAAPPACIQRGKLR